MQVGDLTTLDRAKQWLGITGRNIATISKANPGVVTTTGAHGLVSGVPVGLDQVVGMTQVNGQIYTPNVLSATTFDIGVDTTTFSTYVSGGVVGISDQLMQRLISASSQFVQTYLNRTIRAMNYTEYRDGHNNTAISLLNYPIISVALVTSNGFPVPPRPALQASYTSVGFFGTPGGYVFSDSRVMIDGFYFPRGYQNVCVQYAAGYQISNEAQTIPSGAPYTLTTATYWSAGDRGVTFASNGAALTAVTGTPTTGQYSVSGSVYTFAAADAGKPVLISYSYVPNDVEQATIDVMAEWFMARDRVGEQSKSIEGQSVTFTNLGMSDRARTILQQYRRVVPIPS